jgi:protein-S-isoprenylcysteine O-methyltransferase Ste14
MMSPWRHVRAILFLPTMGTLVIPTAIIILTDQVPAASALASPLGLVTGSIGAALIIVGLLLVVRTVSLFAAIGQGTLAPWDPTRKLVVVGPYRYVRNPMISGVSFVLAGEAVLLRSPALALWFAVFFGVNAVYIPLVEEAGLSKRFGSDYARYKRNVPRWIPRRSPWQQPRDE